VIAFIAPETYGRRLNPPDTLAPLVTGRTTEEGNPMSTRLDLSKITLMDALDLAALIELEARKRYTEFAESLGSRGVDDAGAVFQSMAVNENKHCEEIAERRLALFGDKPAKVTLVDIFDVEAPAVGDVRWNMSALKAYQLALYSEQKAFAFYDEALEYVNQPDVRALFEELREEEAEHVRMLVNIIAKLPPSAEVELEDEDYDPNRPVRDSFEA
jgi:erythrin-vacuolar iron transport family protein